MNEQRVIQKYRAEPSASPSVDIAYVLDADGEEVCVVYRDESLPLAETIAAALNNYVCVVKCSAEQALAAEGVFKGAEGLRRLAECEAFWEGQMYGTRLYFGPGGLDYLHRSVLRAAIAALDKNPNPSGVSTTPAAAETSGPEGAGCVSGVQRCTCHAEPFDHWWDSWVGSDGDGYDMNVHKRHAKAAWEAASVKAALVGRAESMVECAPNALALLRAAKCPNKHCESGGIRVADGKGDWQWEQCQWCDERRTALAGCVFAERKS